MQKDMKEGIGLESFSNGDEYLGYWKNGKFEGYGIMKYSNGGKYKGYWLDGQRKGRGVYTDKKGKSKVGIWDNLNCTEDDNSLYPEQELSAFKSDDSLFQQIRKIKSYYNIDKL